MTDAGRAWAGMPDDALADMSDVPPGASPWSAFPTASEREQERRERAGARLRSLVESVHACPPSDYTTMLDVATEVHRLLLRNGSGKVRVYDRFGECGGFLAIGKLLAAIQRTRDERSDASRELLVLTLSILTDAITHSRTNLRAFEQGLAWDGLVASLTEAVPTRADVIALLMGMSVGHVGAGVRQFHAVREQPHEGSSPAWTLPVVHPMLLDSAVQLADDAPHDVRRAAYILVHDLLHASVRNMVALEHTPLFSRVLRAWLRGASHACEERVLRALVRDGLQHARDVRCLFAHLLEAPSLHTQCAVLDLLYDIGVDVHRAASLTFDVRATDSSADGVSIAALDRPFPPDDAASDGFTLAIGCEVHAIDDAHDAVLDLVQLGPEGSCLRVALDLANHALVYRPGGFGRGTFPLPTHITLGEPHHIVLTHARSAPNAESPVHVYVDGERACTLRVPWPGAFPHPAPVLLGGTAPSSAGNAAHVVWSLSSAFLHDRVVPPSIPCLLYELMPVYTGNLQGPLARFLTYPGMARIQARLDALGEARAPASRQAYAALHTAMYAAAADIFPLAGFYFHVQAAHTLKGTDVLVLNEAVAHVQDAVREAFGHGVLLGTPTVRIPRPLGDAVWGMGGCAVLLALVERADTCDALERAVRLFLRLVTHSWRLAEDAERAQAYGMLSVLLRAHAHLLTPGIVHLLQDACTTGTHLANIPLYRTLLMDTALWTHAPYDVQLAYVRHFAHVLPLASRRLRDVHLVRRLVQFARAAPFVPRAAIDEAVRLALVHYFRPRNIQAAMHFITLVLGSTAPTAAQLGAHPPRCDADSPYPPTECSASLVPRTAQPDARTQSIARTCLDVFVALLSDAHRVAVAAELVHAKWLIILLRPGLARADVPALLELVGMLVSSSPSLAQSWTRLGGFRALERSLFPHWDVPCVMPWLWTLFVGPRKPQSSLYLTFAPDAPEVQPPVLHAQALRVIIECIAHGMMTCRHVRSPRRASLPDTRPAASAQLAILADSVRLVVAYSAHNDVRALLMLAPTLVAVLRACAPRFIDEPCSAPILDLCDSLLDMLAARMAELVLSSHTLTLLHNLHTAMPTSDPLMQSRLCTAVYIPLFSHLDRLIRTRPVLRPTLELVANLLETASNESLRSRLLQLRIFHLAQLVVYAPQALISFQTRMQTSLALERNVLHTLASADDVPLALEFCYNARDFLLTDASDLGFVQCVVHHAWTAKALGDRHAQLCLSYIAAHWPDLVQNSLDDTPEPLPFTDTWHTTLASQHAFLHDLARTRLKAWHTRPSPAALATLNMHTRISAWLSVLRENDALRVARLAQDVREDVAFMRRRWADARDLLSLHGHEPDVSSSAVDWHLDPTEGPCRARIKLWMVPHRVMRTPVAMPVAPDVHIHVSELDAVPLPDLVDLDTLHDAAPTHMPPDSSPHAAALPATATAAAATAAAATAAAVTAEDVEFEDKIRCIMRTLEHGDEVQTILNTARVVGVDVQSSLLVVGTHHLYLLDDYFQRPNGEIVNVWEAPPQERDALVVAAGVGQVTQSSTPVQTWRWDQLHLCLDRAWLHRRTAVELFFCGGQSCLLVLPSLAHMKQLTDTVRDKAPRAVAASDALIDSVRQAPPAPARITNAVLRRALVGRETLAWQEGRLSNAAYLMTLNTVAGRTMNDLTQYPVFPWVLADYYSATLDLTRPASFRQLGKPMGAQSEARHAEFEDRYEQLQQVQLEPFHYGTHYSTATCVCGFLVRVMPFTQILQSLQGGSFDLPDRIFASVGSAWASASERSCADVRELIPEFFFLPDMFVNSHHLDFGTTQAGVPVNHVALPPWAQNDPFLFIQKHREALESDFVSAHLHEWIDLVFGYKSRGPDAVEATNVFHPMSYAHSVDLEGIDSLLERQAAAQVVHNFGQTPAQLFMRPHVPRHPRHVPEPHHAGADFLHYPHLLVQSIAPVAATHGAVAHITGPPDALCASPRESLYLSDAYVTLSFGFVDNSVRFTDDHGMHVAMLEHAAAGRITCMVVLRDMVVFGSDDGMTQLYSLQLAPPHLETRAALHGHTGAVLSCDASPSWSTAVTGSADHTVIVWDLDRSRFVRQLTEPDQPVDLVAIDDQRGWIAAVAGEVWVWSINGDLLVHQSTRSATSDPPTSLSFIARDFHMGKLGVLATGHRDCVVLWDIVSNHARATPPRWRLEKNTVLTLRPRAPAAPITCIYTPTASLLCTGDAAGHVHAWSLPGAAIAPLAQSEQCMGKCDRRFAFLDVKRTCQGCSGLVCNKCSGSYAGGQLRLCLSCSETLASRGMSL